MASTAELGPFIVENIALTDADASAANPLGYFGANYAADLYHSTDNVTWSRIARARTPQENGLATSVLGYCPTPQRVDTKNTLDVATVLGSPASCTDAQFIAGQNQALVGKAGRWELIYFRDVATISGGVRLSTLMRGQRGSDGVRHRHTSGETVILGPFTGLVPFTHANADIGQAGYVAAVPLGGTVAADTRFRGRYHVSGHSLAPWPPCNPHAVRSGSDVAFTWIRRDRLPNVLHDLSGTVAMSEAAELYTFEAWFFDATGATRTLVKLATGLTAPTYTLLAADIAAAGASAATSFVVRITQDNAHGRGWPLLRKVNVEP